ncbi:MAG TPA: hypothetical protein VFB19_17410 [Mycobacterium sp.]|nr:hypothetical protein [Mycobacterium sp.]
MRYNPPPQWPLEPGFNPPPGWTPDPSWQPAPPGWQFWVDDAPVTGPVAAAQWPQQPGPFPGMPYAPPPSHKMRNILIAIGAVVVVVIVAIVIAVLVWPSPKESDSDQIKDVVHAMQNSFNNGDYSTFQSKICGKEQPAKGNFDDERQTLGTLTLNVGSVNVTGDTATAPISVKSSTKASVSNVTWNFDKEGGSWKMCGKVD